MIPQGYRLRSSLLRTSLNPILRYSRDLLEALEAELLTHLDHQLMFVHYLTTHTLSDHRRD